jgi:hypothetical protein
MLDQNTLAALEANYQSTRQQKPKAQPKKDSRKSWLSAIPSIAAAGASFIPGVGTAGAAALGGAGELGRQLISGEGVNLGNVGKEAALSAVPGGLGKIGKVAFKGIRGGSKVTKTAKKAEEAVVSAAPSPATTKVAQQTGKPVTVSSTSSPTAAAVTNEAPSAPSMLSRVKSRMTAAPDETLAAKAGGRIRGSGRNITAGEKVPGTQDVLDQPTADRINAIVNTNTKGITSRTPRGQLRSVQDAKKTKGAELEELTTRFDNKLDDKAYGTIGKTLEKERGKIVGFDPAKKSDIELNNNYASRVGNAKSIKELEEQRKYFDKEAKRILTNPDNKGTLSANLAKAYRDSIDDYVSKVNPALKTAKGEYRDLSIAEDLLARPGTLKPQQNIGVGRLPTLPVKVAQETAGKALQAAGSNKAPARFARGLTGQVATRIAAGAVNQTPQEADLLPPEEDVPIEGELTPAPGTITPETAGGSLAGMDSGTTMKALQAAALQALAKGDTQGIAAIKAVMDIVGTGQKAEKPLSAEAAKVVSNAKVGLEAIDDFEALIAENPGAFNRTGIPGAGTLDNLTGGRVGGALGTDVIDAAGDQIIDVIARLRTGAAISQSEETRFKRYIPRPGDSEKARQQKLGYLRRQFQRVAERSGASGTDTQQLITEGAM